MAALAKRLDELANANQNGLLNDDEYRLLRQNLFEQNAADAVPIAYSIVPPKSIPELRSPPTPRTTKSLGVASLIRRATGRAPPSTTSGNTAPSTNTTPTTVSTATRKRSTLFPRILLKKPTDPSPVPHAQPHAHAHPLPLPGPASHHTIAYPTPSSPSSSTFSGSLLSQSQSSYQPQALNGDIFADHNLHTASDIRTAIASTQAEAQRLLVAFNNLEATTLRRIQKQRAEAVRRAPSTYTHGGLSGSSVNVLLEGKEWHEPPRRRMDVQMLTPPQSPTSLRTPSAHSSPTNSPGRANSRRIPRSVSLAPIDSSHSHSRSQSHSHGHAHSQSHSSHAHSHSHSHSHGHPHAHTSAHHLRTSTSSRADSLRSTRTSLSQSRSISSLGPNYMSTLSPNVLHSRSNSRSTSTSVSRSASISRSTSHSNSNANSTTHPSPLATSTSAGAGTSTSTTSHFRLPSLGGLRRPSTSSIVSTPISFNGSASASGSGGGAGSHSRSLSRSNSNSYSNSNSNSSANASPHTSTTTANTPSTPTTTSARPKLLTLTRSASTLGLGLRRLRSRGFGGSPTPSASASPSPAPAPVLTLDPVPYGFADVFTPDYADGSDYGHDAYGDEFGEGENGDDADTELSDIRTRRADLVARYTARVDFLRAKLKGAELHEKLLRK